MKEAAMEAPERPTQIWAGPWYSGAAPDEHDWRNGEQWEISLTPRPDMPEWVPAARLAEVERERDRMEAGAVVAMDRWHQSQAHADRLEAALRDIARQKLPDEIEPHMRPHADYEGGYEQAVGVARAALQQEGGATDTPPPAPSEPR
jgi:hypothetical protein